MSSYITYCYLHQICEFIFSFIYIQGTQNKENELFVDNEQKPLFTLFRRIIYYNSLFNQAKV